MSRTWSSSVGASLVSAVAAFVLTVGFPASAALAGSTCAGDCDSNGAVTVAELVLAVDLLLLVLPISECTVVDANGDSFVHIAEVVGALNNSINGCPSP